MTAKKTKDDFADHLRRFSEGSCEAMQGPLATITNRDFKIAEDGWYQLVPIGEFPGVLRLGDKREEITQVLDKDALTKLVNSVQGELLIDFEHFASDPNKETRAAGWIQDVELREDGIYMRPKWSGSGKTSIENGDYRFISPEFEGVENLGNGRVRPTKLTGAGLTNKPALKTLKALSNRETDDTTTHQNNNMDYKALLKTLLGLSGDPTDEQIQTAASAFTQTANKDKEAKEIAELKNRAEALTKELVEADLKTFEGVIQDREAVKAALIKDRDGTVALLKSLKPAVEVTTEATAREAIYNRDNAKAPTASETKAAQEADARAAKIRNRASEISKNEGISFSQAWARAEAEG